MSTNAQNPTVQYWLTYHQANLVNNTNQRFIGHLTPPLIGTPTAGVDVPIPANGPLNISTWVHHEGTTPTPGGGVFLGFQKTDNSLNALDWHTVYGTISYRKRAKKNPNGKKGKASNSRIRVLKCDVWPITYVGASRQQVERVGAGTPIRFDQVDTLIGSLTGQSKGQISQYVETVLARHKANPRFEGRVNRAHINEVRNAHGMRGV